MTTHTITLARHTAQVVGLMGVLVLGTWDSYGTEQLLLRHGPEWEGLAIDATFHNVPNDEGVTVLADTDGLVPVPPEACMRASKYATITFRGVQDGVQRISCNLPYMVLDHAQVPGANSTATPSEKLALQSTGATVPRDSSAAICAGVYPVVPESSGVLFVVRAGLSERGSVLRAVEQLERSHAKILGFVLNEVTRESGYYGYRKYGYRRHRYGYGYGYGHGYGYGYGQEKPDSGERSIP